MKSRYACALCAPLLFLAACEDEAGEVDTSATGGKAAGEILGGTISDDMIPLEELTSTSPLAPRAAGSGEPGEAGEEGDAEATDTAEAGTSEEAPAPETATEE